MKSEEIPFIYSSDKNNNNNNKNKRQIRSKA